MNSKKREIFYKYDKNTENNTDFTLIFLYALNVKFEKNVLNPNIKKFKIALLRCYLDNVDSWTSNNLYRKNVRKVLNTIKSNWRFRQFLCQTKPKVTTEIILAYLEYNLCRMPRFLKNSIKSWQFVRLVPIFFMFVKKLYTNVLYLCFWELIHDFCVAWILNFPLDKKEKKW